MSLLRILSRSSLRSIPSRFVSSSSSSSASRLHSSLSSSATPHAFSHRSFSAKKATSIKVDDPYEGSIFTEVPLHDESQSIKIINNASNAQSVWKNTSLDDRIALLKKMMTEFEKNKDSIAADISHQMGKPLKQAKGEVDGCIARARTLCDLAPEALASISIPSGPGFFRQITKEPIGVVLVLVPWNYPLLCTINALGAAILAGNSVIIKQSDRTPLCADHFSKAFEAIGAPAGLVQSLHVDHSSLSKIFSHPSISYVSFTGSVAGGRAVYESVARQRFIDVGLELGGKDAAYVSENVDLPFAIENVVDGAMYNAGQSCCAVERVYVHKNHYEAFLKGATDIVKSYKLGSPFDATTSMGPIAQPRHPSYLASLVDQAKAKGARVLVGGKTTHDAAGKGRFFAPTVVADANHSMSLMVDEAFGPILTVAKVGGDEEAIKLMNDSPFGLTASVWTKDESHANKLVSQLNAGTVFMNRCDFLDPMLPWSGRKDSGKGYGLSTFGFLPYIRTKGYNFRTKTS